MKWMVIFLMALGIASAQAQTNQNQPALVTNMVYIAGLRTINGTVYNPTKSKLWESIGDWLDYGSDGDGVNFEVVSIGKKSVLLNAYINENMLPPMPGHTHSGEFIKQIIVFNFPRKEDLTSGQIFWGKGTCMAIRIDNYHQGNAVVEAYDCGEPYTNKVPVVTIEKAPKTLPQKP